MSTSPWRFANLASPKLFDFKKKSVWPKSHIIELCMHCLSFSEMDFNIWDKFFTPFLAVFKDINWTKFKMTDFLHIY